MPKHSPNPWRFRSVAKRLLEHSELRELDMNRGQIQRSRDTGPCRTVACLAGHWFDICRESSDDFDADEASWLLGQENFAEALGFKDSQQLRAFAGLDRVTWGNDHGNDLFFSCGALAWSKQGEPPARSLSDVAKHLLSVAHRIEASP